MAELFELTAKELLAGYASRAFSPREAMASVLARVDKMQPMLNAVIFLDGERALADAARSEARWLKGEPMGLLDGVPITVKDSVAEASRPMYRGIAANRNTPPVGYDAPPTSRAKEAGAVIFAKTTMPDFGLFGSGVSTAFGVTRNPWNLECNTGGSSSGSGAAVAGGMGPLSIGTDLGGSVRYPAALCGLVGMKPTNGRIPHLPPSSMRSAGPMARTVEDAALFLTVLSGGDRRDYGALAPDNCRYDDRLGGGLAGLRAAVILEGDRGETIEPDVLAATRAAVERLRQSGLTIETIPPLVDEGLFEAIDLLFMMRGFEEFEHLDPVLRESAPPEFLKWIGGTPARSAAEVSRAQAELERYKAHVTAATEGFDYIFSPTSTISSFPATNLTPFPDRPRAPILLTPIWNQTGNPALSICSGFSSAGMPIGLQIIGQRFDDAGVLRLSRLFETIRGFDIEWPG